MLMYDEFLDTSSNLLMCLYEQADEYEVRSLTQLLERIGYQEDCKCGAIVYHYDRGVCSSCTYHKQPRTIGGN